MLYAIVFLYVLVLVLFVIIRMNVKTFNSVTDNTHDSIKKLGEKLGATVTIKK